MFCSKCGTENIDNAMFCKNCGASLYVQQQTQAEKEFYKSPETPKEEVKFESTENADNTENTVKGLIKKHASSQSFFVATILLTVALGLSVISGFCPQISNPRALKAVSIGINRSGVVSSFLTLWAMPR